MIKPKTGGPIVDPLRSPRDETESFLVRLAIAYSDLDEALNVAMDNLGRTRPRTGVQVNPNCWRRPYRSATL